MVIDIKKATVVGAGTMGSGIALVFAQGGISVNLVDVEQKFLDYGEDKIRKFLEGSVKREKMTKREVEIFDQRIFSDDPITLQDIGDKYGISRERVRQIEKNIIKKMRDFFKREIPDFDSFADRDAV